MCRSRTSTNPAIYQPSSIDADVTTIATVAPKHQCHLTPRDVLEMTTLQQIPSILKHPSRSASSVTAKMHAKNRRLRWSTITVHEFGVGLGGSTVPSRGGPPIGLSAEPEFTWSTKVGEMAKSSDGVRRFTREQRVSLLQAAGVCDAVITRYARETNIILNSRKRTAAEDVEEECNGEVKPEQVQPISSPKRSRDEAGFADVHCGSVVRRPRMIPANYV